MSYKTHFQNLVVLCGLLYTAKSEAQDSTTAGKFIVNKKGFFAGAAYIYNYTSPATHYFQNDPKRIVNADPDLYRLKSRDRSTGTFGLHAGYNTPFSKKWSLSVGLEMDQRKEMTEYLIYEDAKLNMPDPVSYVKTRYALFVPFRINYYTGRFIISAGNNVGAVFNASEVTHYDDGSKNKRPNSESHRSAHIELSLRETLSYRVLKNKGLYVQLSAEQSPEFYRSYGYNHFFMAGGAYYF